MTQTPPTAQAARVRRFPAPDPIGAISIAGMGLLLAVGPAIEGSGPTDATPLIPLLLLTAAPLLWVTRAPLLVLFSIVALQSVVVTVSDGLRLGNAEFALIAVLVALGVLAARRPFWMAALGLLVVWGFIVTSLLLAFPGTDVVWILQSSSAMCLFAWGLGLFARANRLRVGRVSAEYQRAARAVGEERARIASELNGIISVDISRMRRDAGIARRATESDHARAREALHAIEATGVEAMNELRRLLHVLRDDPTFLEESDEPGGDSKGRAFSRRVGGLTRAEVGGAVVAVLTTVIITMLSFGGVARWLASAYFAVTLLVLLWRRRFPVTVFALVLASHAGAVMIFHRGDFVWDTFTAMVPVLFALFSVASVRSPWLSAPALVIAWAYLSVPALAYPAVFVENVATYGVVVLTTWLAGIYAGKRGRQIADFEARQDAAASSIARERTRLAYDLHDVIGHSLTIMVVQAAGAARILDRDVERAATAIAAVEKAGAEAAAELAQLVDVLDDGGPAGAGADEARADEAGIATRAGATNGPRGGSVGATAVVQSAPRGLADIEALVERTRDSVGRLELSVTGTPGRLEPSVDLAGFCVVRESLANAVKHDGPGALVDVDIDWTARGVGIRVTSDAGGAEPPHAADLSGGYGLIGVRERVRLAGGEIEWSSRAGRFVVTAELPTAARTPRQ